MAGFAELSVLVVDDCVHMRNIVMAMLRGFEMRHLRVACDGAEALQEVANGAPDIIIVDYRMPYMDGLELARRLRAGRKTGVPQDIPLIMMTGYSDRLKIELARDSGVTEIVAKPLTPKALLSRIVAICDRPRPFVVCRSFVGPDRRRRKDEKFTGPFKRSDDGVGWDALELADA